MILSRILTEQKFEVTAAGSAAEALQALEEQWRPFAIVFVDWRMPTMDGAAFVQRMRTKRAYSQVPVVWMTADATEVVEMEQLPDSPVALHITKPFTEEEIAAVVAGADVRRSFLPSISVVNR